MTSAIRLIAEFGSSEVRPPVRLVEAGGLSFALDGECVRSIKWHGVEVVRAIAWPIRDSNWITLAPEVHDEQCEQDDSGVRYTLRYSVADGSLECSLNVHATPDGSLSAELEMTPIDDFATNRSGFTILHPIDRVAGTPLELRHSDGSVQAINFPLLISPDQPAMDIIGMHHSVAGVDVDLKFSGEIFEMEDQRNWTDASYKTYCVPLVYPFTYTMSAGEKVCQKIVLTLSGTPIRDTGAQAQGIAFSPLHETVPKIALAVEDGWICAADRMDLVRQTGVTCMQVRTGPEHASKYLSATADLCRFLGAQIDAEIVVSNDRDLSVDLMAAQSVLSDVGLIAGRVLALPQAYLGSYQPSGPWPDGAKPGAAIAAARSVFSDAEIGRHAEQFHRVQSLPTGCAGL